MAKVQACPLPPQAFLKTYDDDPGVFADCFTLDFPTPVTLAEFTQAFYTTWLFKLERWVLARGMGVKATDADAERLGRGEVDRYAMWTVEARAEDQILVCPDDQQTRSWLMVADHGTGTRLYFGSSVNFNFKPDQKSKLPNWIWRALFWFHKRYSIALLSRAAAKLRAGA